MEYFVPDEAEYANMLENDSLLSRANRYAINSEFVRENEDEGFSEDTRLIVDQNIREALEASQQEYEDLLESVVGVNVPRRVTLNVLARGLAQGRPFTPKVRNALRSLGLGVGIFNKRGGVEDREFGDIFDRYLRRKEGARIVRRSPRFMT